MQFLFHGYTVTHVNRDMEYQAGLWSCQLLKHPGGTRGLRGPMS